MNDNFERLDLIRRLSDLRSQYNCFSESEREVYHTLSEAIEALEERKTGEWIRKGMSINCSVCKKCSWSLCFEDTVRQFNYCPHCGAKMEV